MNAKKLEEVGEHVENQYDVLTKLITCVTTQYEEMLNLLHRLVQYR